MISNIHCSPSRPTKFAKLVYILAKLKIIELGDPCIMVKFVEDLGRLVWIQPALNDSGFTEYLNVLGSVDEAI
jgi:hypothetical protein